MISSEFTLFSYGERIDDTSETCLWHPRPCLLWPNSAFCATTGRAASTPVLPRFYRFTIRYEDDQLHLEDLHLGDLMCMDTACGCDQPFYDDPIYDRRYQDDYSNGYLATLEQFPWCLLTAYAQVAHLLCPRMEAEGGSSDPPGNNLESQE